MATTPKGKSKLSYKNLTMKTGKEIKATAF